MGGGLEISAREARAKTQLKSGGEVVRGKVEIFTKPDGGQFTVEEVTEILEASGREYGVTWKEDIAPAAETAIEDLAEALGTTRKELESVAKDTVEGSKSGLEDAKVALEEAKRELVQAGDDAKYALDAAGKELNAVAGDAEYALEAGRKELEALKGDVEYAVDQGAKEFNMFAGDLAKAGRQTRDDIKYALEVSSRGDGAVGMVASALGCTTEELVDVVQYFGKEAKAIFKEISEMPELKDARDGVIGIARDAEKMWVSNNGSLVAALDTSGGKVVIGQASPKSGSKRVHPSMMRNSGAPADNADQGTSEAGQ